MDPLFNDNDAVLRFIEDEVGKHDATHNWEAYQARAGAQLKIKVKAWLQFYEYDVNPAEFIRAVTAFIRANGDNWQWDLSPSK